MGETSYMRRLMLAVTEIGGRVFRNNVGMLEDRFGNKVRYGVCNPGGADVIGWRSVTVTPEMVGHRVAVFVAIETKDNVRPPEEKQWNFLHAVQAAGGIGFVAREGDNTVDVASAIARWTPPKGTPDVD